MESMTNAPFYTKDIRFGHKMDDVKLKDLMLNDGLWDAFYNQHMAVNGSIGAAEYGISRQEQDEFAAESQIKAAEAIKAGRLKNEIIPVEIKSKKGTIFFDNDESPRKETTYEKLAKLPPVFLKDGTVTAGNAPGVNDGAGALVYMSESRANELGLNILATVEGYEQASTDSKYITTVPGLATLKLLNKAGMTVDDIDLFEINEAFAAVALVSSKIAKWDMKKVNVDGGAIAYGHPIGATGTRLVMHMIEALTRRGGGYGVCAICSGAAQGDAILIKVK
jgi:acetyl-CoA C-acetyltransferase